MFTKIIYVWTFKRPKLDVYKNSITTGKTLHRNDTWRSRSGGTCCISRFWEYSHPWVENDSAEIPRTTTTIITFKVGYGFECLLMSALVYEESKSGDGLAGFCALLHQSADICIWIQFISCMLFLNYGMQTIGGLHTVAHWFADQIMLQYLNVVISVRSWIAK